MHPQLDDRIRGNRLQHLSQPDLGRRRRHPVFHNLYQYPLLCQHDGHKRDDLLLPGGDGQRIGDRPIVWGSQRHAAIYPDYFLRQLRRQHLPDRPAPYLGGRLRVLRRRDNQRTGASFTYTIPVTSSGSYIVSLYLAEIEGNTKGQRLFTVKSGSQTLLDHFDIFNAVGAKTALISSFTVKTATTSLPLTFTGNTGNTGSATIAAIQVSRIPTSGDIISGVAVGSAGVTDVPAPGWAMDTVPTDSGSDADGEGPSEGQSVSLPSGSSENAPSPDFGATIRWGRLPCTRACIAAAGQTRAINRRGFRRVGRTTMTSM